MQVCASYLPIRINRNHWLACAILNEPKRIVLCDPQGEKERNRVILDNLLTLVGDEFKRQSDCNDEEVSQFLKQWILVDVSKCYPRQTNGYDCGVFTFLFMALHSQGVPMNFSQEDIYQCCGGQGVRGRLVHIMRKLNGH